MCVFRLMQPMDYRGHGLIIYVLYSSSFESINIPSIDVVFGSSHMLQSALITWGFRKLISINVLVWITFWLNNIWINSLIWLLLNFHTLKYSYHIWNFIYHYMSSYVTTTMASLYNRQPDLFFRIADSWLCETCTSYFERYVCNSWERLMRLSWYATNQRVLHVPEWSRVPMAISLAHNLVLLYT